MKDQVLFRRKRTDHVLFVKFVLRTSVQLLKAGRSVEKKGGVVLGDVAGSEGNLKGHVLFSKCW